MLLNTSSTYKREVLCDEIRYYGETPPLLNSTDAINEARESRKALTAESAALAMYSK